MKIAVIYNRESQKVINLFGVPNLEKYGLKTIERIVNALKAVGHQVIALEGDKDLVDKLEEFMPRVLKGERPGIAFNLSYGIQGQARYTHVPGILEMVGIPYVGSGPLAHSLALDKVVAKTIFAYQGLPTPAFAVLDNPSFKTPALEFPLIIKPKNEAVSFGLRIVNDEAELREGAQAIFDRFQQPVLVERYIEGREINVGLLGNNPPEPMEPTEIVFGEGGPNIYTYEDKTRSSGREVGVRCPAILDAELTKRAKELAVRAFNALGCYDCARVDMRIDAEDNLYILEVNSLPSLGPSGSYVAAAAHHGLDYAALVNRLVEVTCARYFGTPSPPELNRKRLSAQDSMFGFLTERRDKLERRVREWVAVSSRSGDAVGVQLAAAELDQTLLEMGLQQVRELTDKRHVFTWETSAGLDGGTLLIGHFDVPTNPALGVEGFRRDPEFLHGEGVGSSRAPLAMLEYALRAMRYIRRLKKAKLGVLYYGDESYDCVESADHIRQAIDRAARVIVLRPGNIGGKAVTGRRGQRRYRLQVEGQPRKLGQASRKPEVMAVLFNKLEQLSQLSSRKDRVAVSAVEVHTQAFPRLLPHIVKVTLQVSYPNEAVVEELEKQMRGILRGGGLLWDLALIADRPPMQERRINQKLIKTFQDIAGEWEIPFGTESSLWPSVAGYVPDSKPVICGIGPVAHDLYTAQETVERISLVQRTLMLAQVLLAQAER